MPLCVLIISSDVAATQGLAKGDVAAIFMTNKPQYVMIELALAKVRGDTFHS
jgi:acyl-coenzyme A synthetase/AMP-(fatty) acid ligase